jgi:hypothetical protein
MENVAVLPVPDCACATTSRPWVMGRIARCWIAEGFSKSVILVQIHREH